MIETVTQAPDKREFEELVKKLDEVCSEAFILWLKSVIAGETVREATLKTAAFLNEIPGYEDRAKAVLDNLEKLEQEEAERRITE